MEEIGCWSDVLHLMENRGFSSGEATEVALQLFNWGFRAAVDRLRPTRQAPADLPASPEVAAQLTLVGETPTERARPARKKEPAKGLHRIPADFELTSDLFQFARDRAFPPAAIDAMWMKFTNHYRGNGATAVDWKAKWRTWVLKTVEFNTRDGRTPGGGDTAGGGFL